MSDNTAQALSIPSQRQVQETIRENPQLINEQQVKSIVHQSLAQLSSIENRLDRLENQGVLKRVWGSVSGATNREMISLMRDMAQSQQTTIKLVLTLAVYHAQNVAVMNDILGELDKAKGLHTRTASHIEFLYEQVQLIRDINAKKKTSVKKGMVWILVGTCVATAILMTYYYNGGFI